ncbi:hydroxyacylglutathione hydrolase [Pseudoalteromonas sp. CO348]|uniref:Hydroxyacylglutathione hydrolase n=1 Tax=Pseudoalteromonas maricaloris TaxID=184924 RepID=A0A8I2GY59_9GAMM|nr:MULTISPECIES: hydroxyacylglutathione hydrolase [Pseudoalteromonas]NLR19873.1 hydroxyacylglutathione hydrolase [Pseudoalteromonas maricaloris]RZG08359.1 hydroxyacylglutathione hydrolase [Pseudoalteromonas sp. CO348]RZG17094.1 hydroxyacylglutathione hydrolase [Pseudoalteromonas sp. CO342X]WOX27542.1 hydroxyacylglutathione hydrolase [Pseudoalteromonas maricaloris]
MVQVDAIKAFDDNYIWVIKDPLSSNCWVIDPGDEQPVLDYLAKFDLTLQGILVTHHHWDHTDGIAPLLLHFPSLTVYGPKNGKYKGITHGLSEHDKITLFDTTLNIIATPGHTLDHICYVNDELAFTGDTLFNAGCGRLFEGTPSQMWRSFEKLLTLPDTCKVYCTHEYTLANLAFAEAVEPTNQALTQYHQQAKSLRANNERTVPTTIEQQKAINPFLRAANEAILTQVPTQFIAPENTPEARFSALRKWKDNF